MDLSEEINRLWDNLPIDTVIATLLDPRTKFFHRIPKGEVNEALAIMKEVYLLFLTIFYVFESYL